MERRDSENEYQMGQQENVAPNSQYVPRNNRPGCSTSPSMSKSMPVKKRKIKTEEANQMHREAYNSMECNAMYLQQRAQALQARNAVSVIKHGSSPSSSSSSSDGQRTPSPDFAPSASHASSPFSGRRRPAEHNYAASSASSSSTDTADSAMSPRARLEPAGPPLATETDSANSSLNDSINPLCISDWYKDLLKPEYAAKLQAQHEVIASRSKAQKAAVIDAKVAELPEGPDYYPNKSRLRKEYDNPEQAAERVRNNQASRLSRFKKKRSQQVLNFQLEYDRNENAYLYAMQNWIEKVIFQLEARWLQQGASGLQLLRLRRECGFPGEIEDQEWLDNPVPE